MKSFQWLCLSLALCLSGAVWAAPVAESWRPEPVGTLIDGAETDWPVVRASESVVIAGSSIRAATWFDLKTGKLRSRHAEGITKDKGAVWKVRETKPLQLEITRDGVSRVYVFPADRAYYFPNEVPVVNDETFGEMVEVRDGAQRVEMLVNLHYYRWDKATRRFERQVPGLYSQVAERVTIAPDGETIIEASSSRGAQIAEIIKYSTRDRKQVNSVTALGLNDADATQISPNGTYALFQLWTDDNDADWRVVNATNGRTLWKFMQNGGDSVFAISRDEKLIAIRQKTERVWEIRNLSDGTLVRTLPLLSSARAADFSPDSSTLYVLAGGILYRQRAR